MAADLFETYAVTAVAVMLLGVLTFGDANATQVALYPLVLGGVAIVASIIGTFAVKSAAGKVEAGAVPGLVASGLIAAVAFYPVTKWLMDGVAFPAGQVTNADLPGVGDLYLCTLIGLGVTRAAVPHHRLLTPRRASTPSRRRPRPRRTGHATNIHLRPLAGHAGDGAAGDRARLRHLRRRPARRHSTASASR